MATDIEYALMAGRVYQSTRQKINWFPDLQSQVWTEFFHQQEPSGFEAVSFQRGTDIIISYAGTGSLVDWLANGGGFLGEITDQLKQAANYYFQVKAANPGANISFTGHSLGGGLASLMGVFFDENAVTFDQAPFRRSASNLNVASDLKVYLLSQNYSEADLQDLTNFINASTLFTIPNEANVRNLSVQGEILSRLFPFSRLGPESSLLHGTTDLLLAKDLHSQALLSAFVQNDQFRQVTFKLPDVVRMIFDSRLYAFPTDLDTNVENFLERLVRHQNGITGNPTTGELAIPADAMLTRFTNDLNKIAQDGGLTLTNTDIAKTLTAFAMQMYYPDTANATNPSKQLFTAVTGGIQFDRADVAATLDDALGYNLYFQNYLDSSVFSNNARYLIRSVLPTLRDWYVQAGSVGMNVADTQNRGAFLLGGSGVDSLTGGTQADLLVGNAGADTLAGGGGFDTYIYTTGNGQDVISDNDGLGRILFGNYPVNGGIHQSTDAGNTYFGAGQLTYVWNGPGTDLMINNLITVQNFQDGQLGITLDDLSALPDGTPPVIDYNNGLPNDTYFGTAESDAPGPLGGGTPNVNETVSTFGGDDFPFFYSSSQGNHVVFLGSGHDYVEGALGHDRLYGEDGRDILLGGGAGDDVVEGGAGEDFVRGGPGNDVLKGGADADTVVGDSGNDVVLGEDGNDVVSGESQGTPVELMGNDYVDGGNGADWVFGLLGNDHLVGGAGDDQVYGDQVPDTYPEYRYDWPGSITPVAAVPFTSTTGGADLLDGGDGNDFLQGDAGDDVLLGGADNDQLYGDDQNQYAVQAGNDWLDGEEGDDTVVGGGGNDTLSGGAGIDKLYGDVGDDLLDGGSENDELYGGDGADVVFGGSGDDLVLGDALNNPSAGSLAGGDDVLDGGDGNDHLEGGIGDDSVFGGTGNDVLFGQDGADALAGDDGNDQLQGGDGNDLLTGDAGDDLLFGQAGADTIYGDDGNDQLTGATGDDMLEGGGGNDLYVFNLGDGDDVITDTALPGEGNTIVFGPGITLANLILTQDQQQHTLTIQVGGGGDTIQLDDFDLNNVDGTVVVQTLAFSDSTAVALASLLPLPGGFVNGSTADDVISTGTDADVIQALDGNDTVTAGAGNDLLVGGVGNDTLSGGAGNDIYVFNAGDGVDTINDSTSGGDINTLAFGDGITSNDITLGLGSLLIRVGASGDAIHVTTFDPNDAYGPHAIENIQFADGTALSYGQLIDKGFDLTGTSGADTMTGTNAVDRMTGLAGNDTLSGGAGDDTYIVNLGDGVDTIQDTSTPTEGNSIRFGAGITVNDLTLTEGPNILTITYGTGGDAAQLTPFDRNNVNGSLVVKTLRFADGSSVPLVDLLPGNDPPYVANPIVDQTVPEDAPLSLTVPANTFADPDAGDTLTLVASLANGNPLPAWLSFDAPTATFSGTPDDPQVGTVSLRVTATDTGGLSVADAFNLTVTNVNEAPAMAIALPDQNARATEPFSFAVPATTFTDVDAGDSLTYSAILDTGAALPAWLNFDPVIRTFSGTPQSGNVGSFNVRVTATDSGNLSASDVFAVTVDSSHTFTGTPGNDNLIGTAGDDVLNGLGGDDVLNGLAGNDVLDGGNGNDVLDGGTGSDSLSGGDGDDILYVEYADYSVLGGAGYDTVYVTGSSGVSLNVGTNGVEVAYGGMGNDYFSASGSSIGVIIDAGAGNDTLVGGDGVDMLIGGTGDDSYFITPASDTLVELPGEGMDWVTAYNYDFTLPANVEELQLYYTLPVFGYAAEQNGTGNELNNTIYGNEQINTLWGGAGDDYLQAGGNISWGAYDVLYGEEGNDTLTGSVRVEMYGGPGDDTYILTGDLTFRLSEGINEGIDTIQSPITYVLNGSLENLTLTGFDPINGTGNALDNRIIGNESANVLTGGDGNDTLDGGGGDDSLSGGAGDDTYIVDSAGDTINEPSSGGTDTVMSAITYTLGARLENLTLTGTAAINGTGNSSNNVLDGSQNSAVNVLIGGSGNDTYIVDSTDTIVEGSNGGTDTVQTAQTYALTANLENLTLTGTNAINGTGNTINNVLTGNSAANTLTGGAGNDTLDGAAGADTFLGGTGNDTYVVDDAGDAVTENAAEGTDIVQSSITYTLGANVENLTLTGPVAVNGTGNALNNTINGNSGANVLDGGAGADTMAGGAGDDTYIMDNTSDVVTEATGAGIDTVRSSVTFTLASNVENVILIGSTAIDATGNSSDNVLDGSQNSTANTLTGGAGNDTYIVGSGDTVVEKANGGTDTVQSAASYVLGSNVENLTLTGTLATDGTGNTLANTLAGNNANNTLTGLAGNDTYLYDRGAGQDTVVDGSGSSDVLLFGASINPLDLVLSRQVNDLRIALHGSTDQVAIQNWYTSPTTNQVETMQAGNGQQMLNTQVDQLIQAMAAFSTQTGLTWDQAIDQRPQDVQNILAASWQ